MLRAPGDRPHGDSGGWLVGARALAGVFASLTCSVFVPTSFSAATPPTSKPDLDAPLPVAGAFVYPVGDELDYTKGPGGTGRGYRVSDPYRAERRANGSHQGVDLSNGAGGAVVRSIASGVVTVADRNARVSVRKKERVTRRVLVKGKRVTRTTSRWRTSWKWRTGWGNYVLIRHILPNGETVYSLYAHLASGSVQVRSGDIVAAGQAIGKIGRSGRASSPHLHLEIRRSAPSGGGDGSAFEEEISTPEARHFARLTTIDPLAFLNRHVRRYEDLDPGSWEARYALAACRDGLTSAEGERFAPREAMKREDYYRALVFAFRLSSAFPSGDWGSAVAALTDAGILDAASAKRQDPDDKFSRSEALELLLRCLDGHRAHAHNLSSLDAMQVGRDFNRQFAGAGAAERAEREAKATAAKETEARRKAAIERSRPKGKNPGAAKSGGRSKRKAVRPVKPVPILDPGFESLAKSEKSLSRAEGCLLIATALRPGSERYSALQRAAIRIAQSE